ncbi:MAG: type I restriction enzyme HsdR N-terminal domain-containing protein [Bacteroidota bacterium]
MKTLKLPRFDHQFLKKNGKVYIFDIIRKKYVNLTPEEWVRQHMVHYLINHCAYNPNFITVERSLGKTGRADVIIYNRNHQLYMLIECKAAYQPLNTKGIFQIAKYNMNVKAPFITITNGVNCLFFQKNEATYTLLKDIPPFPL